MNRVLYENRCKCNEDFSLIKKRKLITPSKGKPLQYPNSDEIISKIFQIKYEKHLSSKVKFILNSFQNKYLYYAIDDVLYLFNLEFFEQKNLLEILYSPVLSLHNNFSINFFDIWIREIYIDEISKSNKFLMNKKNISKSANYITIRLFYKKKVLIKKQESLW